MFRLLAIPIFVMGFFMTACQTSMLKQFSEVKPGMEKDDVLELMGSPSQTQRFHGKDRWTYVFYDNRIRFEKEVQFFDGNAIYVGDSWQPESIQAATQIDAANEVRNKELDQQALKQIEQHRKNYEEYEAQSKGEDKVRYVPSFEPIR